MIAMKQFPASYASANSQRGVALAISLILLVAITILGVATLSSTRLNEQITSNVQQKAVAFEVAESAINAAWNVPALRGVIDAMPAVPFHDPIAIVPAGLVPILSVEFDQTNVHGTSLDIAANISIHYCGETALPEGSSLSADLSQPQMVGYLFNYTGSSEIQNSNTRAEHVQRASLTGPKTARTGDCVVPGS